MSKNFIQNINNTSFEMVFIEGSKFLMGGNDSEAYNSEKPIHEVAVPSFYLGKYPVTQSLWEALTGTNPSNFKGNNRPVENVSWEDAQRFIEKLKLETGKEYRLPSETEWEYAARGGKKTEGYLYSGSDNLNEVGWYNDNSGGQTHPVGEKMGNELGLFDMSGNVREWCEDDWHGSYQRAPLDGSVWMNKRKRDGKRVVRGGNWFGLARLCRVSFRYGGSPGYRSDVIGFRLALSPGSGS